MALASRLQAYLRHSAAERYEPQRVPPFTLFFHRSDPFPHFNYAIPDEPISGDVAEPLATLRAAFRARGRLPRFEFVEPFAPGLAGILSAAGFAEEARNPLMLCTRDSLRAAPDVAGLDIVQVPPDAPLRDVQGFLDAQRRGFDSEARGAASEEEAERYRATLHHGRAFLGRLAGEPVGAAVFTTPWQGITELVGIATRAAFRRQGVASALTAAATRVAFEQGVELASLSAGDEQAGRVYERVGFRPFATMLAYSAP